LLIKLFNDLGPALLGLLQGVILLLLQIMKILLSLEFLVKPDLHFSHLLGVELIKLSPGICFLGLAVVGDLLEFSGMETFHLGELFSKLGNLSFFLLEVGLVLG
jgi:hypothetical protein